MMFSRPMVARFGLIILTALGTLAGAKLTLEHLKHGEVCPTLGPIPACIIVLLGYALMLFAAVFIMKQQAKLTFILGWVPVFLLAFIGVTLELIQGETCPAGGFGLPQCFFSLGMVLACLFLFKVSRMTVSLTGDKT